MSLALITNGFVCPGGFSLSLMTEGFVCVMGEFQPKCSLLPFGMSVYVVADPLVKTYEIGFPVEQNDLAVWINGIKIFDGFGYNFIQSTNSVEFTVDLNEGDEILFRIMRSL